MSINFRLINTKENSSNLCNININQKSTDTSERFMSAKKLFEKSTLHDNIKENKLLSCSSNIIEGSKEV